MDITITINAPDLSTSIKALAEAIGWAVANQQGKVASEIKIAGVVPSAPPPAQQLDLVPPEATPEAQKTVTFEQLQAKAAEFVRAGKKDALKVILDKLGVSKVSQIPAESRAVALAELEAG